MSREHKLRSLRRERELSLEALAVRIDCAKSTLSRIENWAAYPSPGLIVRLCSEFAGLEPNDFFVEPIRGPRPELGEPADA